MTRQEFQSLHGLSHKEMETIDLLKKIFNGKVVAVKDTISLKKILNGKVVAVKDTISK